MTKTSKRTSPRKKQSAAMLRLARQSANVLALSPTVAARRMMQLSAQRPAAAATSLGTMGLEKMTTFGQAWMAMASAAMQAQFKFAMSMWTPKTSASMRTRTFELGDELVSMASSAMKPVHARVKRNAGNGKRR